MSEPPSAQPFLSVIIPTRNGKRPLGDCLRSLAEQDYPHSLWEVIVIFDGEDVQPDEELAALARRIPLTIATQRHAGCGIARNTGVSRARGRFLAFTDDDCLFPTDWLTRYAEAFTRDPESLVAGHSINALRRNFYSQTTQDLVEFLQERASTAARRAPLAIGNNFGVAAEGFRELGGFHERYHRLTAEDRDFSVRWVAAGRRIVDGVGIIVYHAHALELRSFLHQHYGYGRGAYVFHHAPPRGRSEGVRWQPADFYISLLLWPISPHRGARSARLWPFLLISQCAHVAGYLRQSLSGM